MLTRARSIANEYERLSKQLSDNFDADVAKKLGTLGSIRTALQEWEEHRKVRRRALLETSNSFLINLQSLEELHQLLVDPSTDPELRDLATEEAMESKQKLESSFQDLKASLAPTHPFARLPCLLELRPGAGGSEAAIFTADLLRMYQGFCKRQRLRASLLKLDAAEGAGEEQLQEAVLEIESEGAYGLLRCEAGVHRVQRVPATEKQGRTHTSAASVLVLPSFPENIADVLGEESFEDPNSDYFVDSKDVRVDVMRARGAGGQHVNTTDSAVRLTHVPTNTVVSMQDSRSQQKNRQKAWRILRSRIAQARREAREDEMAQMRLNAIGIARMGRGDKVRTYNWGQQRVTDHRSGLTMHSLDDIVAGGDSLNELMQSVRSWMMEQELNAVVADEAVATKSK